MVTDYIIGDIGYYLFSRSKQGATYKIRYLSDLSKDSVVIFGSSRAVHHYKPSIIEDSINMTCYNAANDGCGIIYNYGIFTVITSRYIPKFIIYDICPKYDLFEGDNEVYLTNLKLYYGKGEIQKIFEKINYKENLKMLSQMYKYNSQLISMFSDYKTPKNDTPINKGYAPKYNIMNYEPKPNPDFTKLQPLDSIKIFYLEKLITECKRLNIKLCFTVSPCYKYTNDSILNSVKKLSNKYGILFIDHFDNTYISTDAKYWADGVHLNDQGATAWTSMFIHELKETKLWQ